MSDPGGLGADPMGGQAQGAGPGTGPEGSPAAIALTPLIAGAYRTAELERIAAASPGSRLVSVSADGVPDGPLDDVEVLLLGIMPSETMERILARAPQVRWIHSATAGVERVLTPTVRSRRIVVTNARGVFSVPIAEYVVLMILAVCRRLPQLLDLQRERTWQPLEGVELRDVTVGIVGLGSIGRAIAALLAPFGTRVVAVRRHPDAGAAPAGETLPDEIVGARPAWVSGPEGLPALLAESDFVVLTLPLTPQTENLMNEERLGLMKPGAWLVNIARGRLVDERALVRALRQGPLGGAVLDAFREEPLPPTSPLYGLPNVILTPHTSWASGRVRERTIALFCANLERFRRGAPLLNVVDVEAGY
jgi:phosphoglycerate dehydrogenase-like enzyme